MYTSELICMKLMCVSVGGAADAVHSGDGGVGSAWGWQPTRCTPHGTTPSHFPFSFLFYIPVISIKFFSLTNHMYRGILFKFLQHKSLHFVIFI